VTVVTHPTPGTIVRVDLNEGFRKPEMRKRRPCIILSPPILGRSQLCTIVPLSTNQPNPEQEHHYKLTLDPPLPHPYESPVMWVKADIVLTVAFHRLRLLFSHWEGSQRAYDVRQLDGKTFEEIKECVRSGIGL